MPLNSNQKIILESFLTGDAGNYLNNIINLGEWAVKSEDNNEKNRDLLRTIIGKLGLAAIFDEDTYIHCKTLFGIANVLVDIDQVRAILAHECSQNRKYGNINAFVHEVLKGKNPKTKEQRFACSEEGSGVYGGNVYYYSKGHGSVVLTEKQGLLSLTVCNDASNVGNPPVQADVIDFIRNRVHEKQQEVDETIQKSEQSVDMANFVDILNNTFAINFAMDKLQITLSKSAAELTSLVVCLSKEKTKIKYSMMAVELWLKEMSDNHLNSHFLENIKKVCEIILRKIEINSKLIMFVARTQKSKNSFFDKSLESKRNSEITQKMVDLEFAKFCLNLKLVMGLGGGLKGWPYSFKDTLYVFMRKCNPYYINKNRYHEDSEMEKIIYKPLSELVTFSSEIGWSLQESFRGFMEDYFSVMVVHSSFDIMSNKILAACYFNESLPYVPGLNVSDAGLLHFVGEGASFKIINPIVTSQLSKKIGVAPNFDQAIRHLKCAYALGDISCAESIADQYLCRGDLENTFYWLKRSCTAYSVRQFSEIAHDINAILSATRVGKSSYGGMWNIDYNDGKENKIKSTTTYVNPHAIRDENFCRKTIKAIIDGINYLGSQPDNDEVLKLAQDEVTVILDLNELFKTCLDETSMQFTG